MSTCKGCGRAITWATNPATGKRVPLDMAPKVYRLVTFTHRPLFDDLEAAKMALATATLQGLDVVLLSFSLVDAEIEATP